MSDNNIKHVIGVVSGKGGVGKSMTCSLLACAMQRAGLKTGILDADITGPSIPKMFGIHGRTHMEDGKMAPAAAGCGVKLMSANLLLDREDEPVIWRGPLLNTMIKRFFEGVGWGELDVLLIDMPPGTSDVPLTVYQSLPIEGIVMISTPQSLVEMIVKKASSMAGALNIPLLALVQNFSYLSCPNCSEVIYPYGKGRGEELAGELGTKIYAQIPWVLDAAQKCDAGEVSSIVIPEIDALASALVSSI